VARVAERWLRVRLSEQVLELLEGDRVVRTFAVSTSARGAGERAGSEQTPRGRHEIREVIGAGEPPGAVFVGRRPTGEVCSPDLVRAHPGRDWILSRILWLGGLEEGRNRGGEVDSFARFVYVHGTADEASLGSPRSHGCIRMSNADVIELLEQVAPGTLVEIIE
jgi:hypothetical protein